MYKKRNAFRGKRTYRPRHRKTAKQSKSSHSTIKKVVKNMLSRNLEVKEIDVQQANKPVSCPSGSAPDTTWGTLNLMPQIAQGYESNKRIGNAVRTKYSAWKGQVNLLPYNSITNTVQAIEVVMYLVKYKKSNVATPPFTDFFQKNDTTIGFTNSPLDCFSRVNEDSYRVCAKRKFRLNTNTVSGQGVSGQDGPARFVSFNLARFIKKGLRFDDNTNGNLPTNDNLWLLTVPVQQDGGASDVQPIEIHYENTYRYTDA